MLFSLLSSLVPETVRTRTVGRLILQQQRTDPTPHTQLIRQAFSETEMSGTLRDKMARLTPTQRPTVKDAVADAVRRVFVSGTMSFAAEALIVSGRKSAG